MKNYLLPLLAMVAFFSCSPNNVKQDDDLGKYFNENNVMGSFALMDNGTGKFTVYNLANYRDSSYLPAFTFNILNSLIGLQTGVITNDSMVIKWDSVKRNDAWDKNLNMYNAFRVSSIPYFQEVARRIGKDTMQAWLDSLKYGTMKIKTTVDSFWLDNSLKIIPDEQLGLVKELYFDQLPFFKRNQEIVKTAMQIENNSNYRLGYSTGLGKKENNNSVGWVLGWIEENNHPYFFVLNVESSETAFDMVKIREKMLKDILKYLGFFEGKM